MGFKMAALKDCFCTRSIYTLGSIVQGCPSNSAFDEKSFVGSVFPPNFISKVLHYLFIVLSQSVQEYIFPLHLFLGYFVLATKQID